MPQFPRPGQCQASGATAPRVYLPPSIYSWPTHCTIQSVDFHPKFNRRPPYARSNCRLASNTMWISKYIGHPPYFLTHCKICSTIASIPVTLHIYYIYIKSQISFQKQSVLKSRSEGKTWPEQPSTYSFHSVHCVHCLLHILCPLCPFLSVAIAVFEKCAKMWFMRVVKTEKFEHAIDLSPG